MKLDEAIKRMEEIAEEAQKIVDTHYFSDTVSIDEIYCDDTEIIEEQLAGYQKCAEEHRQLAEWLRELKQLREQTRWIPTSEKLPRKNEYVGNVDKHYLIQDEFGDMQVVAYTNRGWIPIHTIEAIEYDVVAWMPLPKQYNAEMENEE